VEIPFLPIINNFSLTNLLDALPQSLTQHTSFTKQKLYISTQLKTAVVIMAIIEKMLV
jgi:hypothetical protein